MKRTLHLQANSTEDIEHAARLLREGGLVAFATETVYGLGANALSAGAVQGIFTAKQRPAWDPLIVHVADAGQAAPLIQVEGEVARRVLKLGSVFWPGPLTLLLPRSSAIPDAVTAGRERVGLRVPAHPTAQALLLAAGVPVAAPSANRFGHISPTTAEHVLADLDGRIDAVLDAGPCVVGVESTVLDPEPTPMVLYRAGAVTREALQRAGGVPVEAYLPQETSLVPAALPSPGVGLRHYAPDAMVHLTGGSPQALQGAIRRQQQTGVKAGVLVPADWAVDLPNHWVCQPWGRWANPEELAREVFAGLRSLEAAGVGLILCPLPEAGGLRDALRDRLLKAAKPR